MEAKYDNYLSHLLQEMDTYAEMLDFDRGNISSIYIGGGTPSLLPAGHIAAILEKLGTFGVKEITIEANPESLTKEKLISYKKAGVTRISLGVQSTFDDTLYYLGRIHTFDDVRKKVELIREYTDFGISLDLIYSIPKGHDIRLETERLLELKPDHISTYSLKIEEGTALEIRGEAEIDGDRDRDNFKELFDVLSENGYSRYEISNFAKKGHESRHNMHYWKNKEYYGFGLGASGYLEGVRYDNFRTFDEYYKSLENGELPRAKEEVLSGDDRKFEHIMLSLRLTEGFSVSEFNELYDADFLSDYREVNEKLIGLNLIELGNQYIRLTYRGFDIINTVILEYM